LVGSLIANSTCPRPLGYQTPATHLRRWGAVSGLPKRGSTDPSGPEYGRNHLPPCHGSWCHVVRLSIRRRVPGTTP